jgi:hypothetical protein
MHCPADTTSWQHVTYYSDLGPRKALMVSAEEIVGVRARMRRKGAAPEEELSGSQKTFTPR